MTTWSERAQFVDYDLVWLWRFQRLVDLAEALRLEGWIVDAGRCADGLLFLDVRKK